jgi:aspartyl-tRNA synthetase
MFERLIKQIIKDVKQQDYTAPVERMTWEEAMWRFGNDKPDIRFGMQLANFKFPAHTFPQRAAAAAGSLSFTHAGFGVFDAAETIIGMAVTGCAAYTRKQLDEITEWVKRPQIGMQGLVYIKCNNDGSHRYRYRSNRGRSRFSAGRQGRKDQKSCQRIATRDGQATGPQKRRRAEAIVGS